MGLCEEDGDGPMEGKAKEACCRCWATNKARAGPGQAHLSLSLPLSSLAFLSVLLMLQPERT